MTTKREELSDEERARKLVQEMGVLRPRDLAAHGIPPRYASRLAQEGLLERVDRGLYTATDGAIHEYQTLVEVSRRMPHSVICMLSALRFHDLTTQAPFEVCVRGMGDGRRSRLHAAHDTATSACRLCLGQSAYQNRRGLLQIPLESWA